MLATASASVPLWTWLFFAGAIVAVLVLMSVGLRRSGFGGATGRRSARSRGLSAEQLAFQDEMRLMLEARLRHKGDPGEKDERGAGAERQETRSEGGGGGEAG
jgi:hypothetical protein